MLQVLGIRLRAAGYDVRTAADGVAGLEAAESDRPEIIVLDLRLPGMDGLSVLSRLTEGEATRAIPVVVLSANVVDWAKTRALELGARYFLEKPYDARRLIEVIGAAVSQPKPPDKAFAGS